MISRSTMFALAFSVGVAICSPAFGSEWTWDLYSIEVDDLRGFVDQSGHIVVPPIYDQVFSFREGLAAVKRDGKWGFIDSSRVC